MKPFFSVRTTAEFQRQVVRFGFIYILAFQAAMVVWRLRGIRTDPLLVAVAHLLTAVGFAVLVSRVDPLRDSLLFVRYAKDGCGVAVMVAVSLVDFGTAGFLTLSYLPLIGALSLSVLLILFGTGRAAATPRSTSVRCSRSRRSVCCSRCFSPGSSRAAGNCCGSCAARCSASRCPRWLNVPRADYVLPVLVGVGLALVFFFLQKDLGPALMLSCVFLAVYGVARGRVGLASPASRCWCSGSMSATA